MLKLCDGAVEGLAGGVIAAGQKRHGRKCELHGREWSICLTQTHGGIYICEIRINLDLFKQSLRRSMIAGCSPFHNNWVKSVMKSIVILSFHLQRFQAKQADIPIRILMLSEVFRLGKLKTIYKGSALFDQLFFFSKFCDCG